jgi:hypothetical protein
MVHILSREEIKRYTRGGVGGSGGGGSEFDPNSLTGYATEAWCKDNFVTIAFFDQIFQVYNDQDKLAVNGEMPVDTSKLNIKAMFGFWTDFYLTALGNGGEIGASIYLAGLADVNVAGVQTGQVLTWNAATNKWIATTPQSGVDMNQVWNALAAQTSQQINASHLSTALAGYATQTWVGQQGFATTAWVNQQGFSTTSWVNSQLSNYLPLAGGAMVAGARISSSGGNLIIGNSNNAAWLMLQDVCSQNGASYWKIEASGNATFANVLSNGYVTALSDQREKNIIENFEVSLKYIAEAPVVSYTWKDKRRGDKQHIGSIAQYWLREMPELVPEVNGRYTMDYGRIALLCAILIARYVVNLIERITRLEKTLRGE